VARAARTRSVWRSGRTWTTRDAKGHYAIDRSRDYAADLGTFEASLAAARQARPPGDALPHLQAAIAAYGGDLLPDLTDAEWAEQRRLALRREFSVALAAAGRMLGGSGRLPEALELYRRAVEHDPLDETTHRRLMQCLADLGEPGQAAAVYRDLASRLRDELGVAPAADTTAIYRRLAGSSERR
jgi:DNA-binding SARP family transcriptional activator